MSARPAPRNPRTRASLASIVSLVVAVGLTSSGLARSVWGAPPDEQPTASAPEASPADDLNADPLAADPNASGPNAPGPDASPVPESPPADDMLRDEAAASVPGASSLRAKMEASLSEIGELAVEARADEDLVRATCVLDKQDKANDVMDLGTSELLIIRDPGTSDQARSFALEKLDAASGRLDKLVAEAKSCSGQTGPEDEVDVTRTDADEPDTLPIVNPSAGLGHSPVPPPMDGAWPPAASPIE